MSGIAGIANIPTTEQELLLWATNHATHHVNINQAIFRLTDINLPNFILDPINPDDIGVWEAQHQIEHNNMDAILGITGFDLSEVDFKKTEYLAGWIQLNFNEHYIASNLLGIG